jgi:peptidoglycan/LPS O-acetylase OafA/YrhL
MSLELGRFAAASLVALAHLIYEANQFATPAARLSHRWDETGAMGIIGVEYFFVLSGFVMLLTHAGDFGQLAAVPRFYWRRLCRIFPVYWLILPMPLALFLPPQASTGYLFGVVTLISPDATRYINPAWTLRYELAFYLLFGLALLPVVGRAILALWIGLLVWSVAPLALQNATYHPLLHFIRKNLIFNPNLLIQALDLFFVAGLAAALAYRHLPLGRRAGLALIALAAALLIGAAPAVNFYMGFPAGGAILAVDGGFAALILGLAVLERSADWQAGRWAGWLGDMSYPLYLLHLPLIVFVTYPLYGRLHVGRGGIWLLTALFLVLVYAAAALLTWAFDRPVRRALGRIRLGQRRAA